MARKTKKKLLGGLGRIAGKVAGLTPAGRVAKTALGVAKGGAKALGFGKGTAPRRSRGITQKYLNRAATRLVKARIEGKILREKMKVVNIVR